MDLILVLWNLWVSHHLLFLYLFQEKEGLKSREKKKGERKEENRRERGRVGRG